jgi:uncharacterized membrane protein YphA (DoxX/SURF4 family)
MRQIVNRYNAIHDGLFGSLRKLDGLGPLALRLYLVPVFWVAGTNKLSGFGNVVEWFGNSEWGLGLPFPVVMAFLATWTEIIGAVLLLLGLAVRWISVPLIVTMLVAIFLVHWDNGWQAVHDLRSPFPAPDAAEAVERLDRAKAILQEQGNYDWLTEKGSFVVSNNGIEWGVTYFVMLLALFFTGGGRYFSLDYWLKRLNRRS